MLIYAKERENDGVNLFIYFFLRVKRSVSDSYTIEEKKTVKKAQVKCSKNVLKCAKKSWVPGISPR